MTEMLTALSIIFIVAGPFVLFANRLNLPSVPLLILAGIVAGNFIDEQITLDLARYGIALLVFVFGARIQFDAVRVVLGDSELVALGQVVLLGSVGVGLGILLGIPIEQAFFFGIAASLSSTIVGTELIREDIRNNLVRGRLAESIQYVQDIIAIGIVLVIGAEALNAEAILVELSYGALLFLAAIVVHRYLFGWIERLAAGSDETMLIAIIALLVGFLGVTEFVGVSIVVGAFAAGLAVRHDPVGHLGIFNGLESIRDFFVAIFFVTVGALVTIPTIDVLVFAFVLVVLTTVIKPAISLILLIHRGYEARSATLTSLNLDQVSEFALIIAIEALLLGLLVPSMFDAIILAAAVTMIISGLTQMYGEQIYHTLSQRGLIRGQHKQIDARSNIREDVSDHIVVVGFGRQGRHLATYLEDIECPYIVIENDPILLDEIRSNCKGCVFGDAMERYTWEKAAADRAKLIISTVQSEEVSNRILSLIGDTDLIVRAEHAEAAEALEEAGARFAYIDDALAGKQLGVYLEALEDGMITAEKLRDRSSREHDDQSHPLSGRDLAQI